MIYNVKEVTCDGLLYFIRVRPRHPKISQVIRNMELPTSLALGECLRVSTELRDKVSEFLLIGSHWTQTQPSLFIRGWFQNLQRLTSFIQSGVVFIIYIHPLNPL